MARGEPSTPAPSVPAVVAVAVATTTPTAVPTVVPTAVPTAVATTAPAAPIQATQPVQLVTAPAQVYVVQRGDTLFSIARRHGTTVDWLVVSNGLGSKDTILRVGLELVIPSI